MHFTSAVAILASVLAITVSAGPIAVRDNDAGLPKICGNLKTQDKGCIRYVRGFDVTGVVTEVDLVFPQIKDKCDCIQACLDRPTTCASWVYKFSTPDSVKAGHRTCTLYSQFNLPSAVNIQFDLYSSNSTNLNAQEILANGSQPQKGALVAPGFKDANIDTTPDNDAFSGAVWQLSTGHAIC